MYNLERVFTRNLFRTKKCIVRNKKVGQKQNNTEVLADKFKVDSS